MIIVCGGGNVCRKYQAASEKIAKPTDTDKDWIGIRSTQLNAELVRVMFKDKAYPKVIYNPNKKIKTNKKIIIGAGFEPGCSTDTDTTILAKQFNSRLIINTTNTDYVYDKDPHKYKNAKKVKQISWKEYRKLIGSKFSPGLHAPFDPVASRLAAKHNMKVAIINGRNLENLKKILNNEDFIGTIIG
jgi:uridylate kinase